MELITIGSAVGLAGFFYLTDARMPRPLGRG
jgi:hypothetical protein